MNTTARERQQESLSILVDHLYHQCRLHAARQLARFRRRRRRRCRHLTN